MNPFKMAKVFNIMPKWLNFAKSGHTGGESQILSFELGQRKIRRA